ncbi:MAG: cupin domain-containing protein [Phycicoccus sp.]
MIYGASHAQLAAQADVLDDVLGDIDTVLATWAETPGVEMLDLRLPHQLRDLVLRRGRAARRDLAGHEPGNRRPVVVTPGGHVSRMSVQGQPVVEAATAPGTATRGISSGELWMPPGHTSKAHVHRHTDVIVRVLHGSTLTLWWDSDNTMQEPVRASAGDHLHIPAGVPHAAWNDGPVPAIGAEFRASDRFAADVVPLPELDADVAALVVAAARRPVS